MLPEASIYMGKLEEVYGLLEIGSPLHDKYPCSAVFYASYLIRDNLGLRVDLETLEQVMYQEGVLPASEYKLPRWYAKKYFPKEVPR